MLENSHFENSELIPYACNSYQTGRKCLRRSKHQTTYSLFSYIPEKHHFQLVMITKKK